MWEGLKHFFWQTRGVWITIPTVAGLVILLRLGGVLQGWEWDLFDFYMKSRPPETKDDRIAIVGINENDLHRRNESIISDQVLGELLNKLKAQNPRAIGLDIYRDLPVPPGHDTLVEVFETTPNLVGIQKVAGEVGWETVAPPPILKEKGQVGANDLIFDGDNRVRRGLISLDTEDGETVYSFGLHLALHYLDQEGIGPEMIPGTDQWKLGKTLFSPLNPNDGGYVRTDAGGYQLLINYRGGDGTFETVSMTDILDNKVPADWASDRIIIIGKVGESFKDLFFTPYSSGLIGLPEPVAGAEIHANLVSQILSASLEDRPLFKTWSDPLEWLWIVFWAGMGATLTWTFRYQQGSKNASLKRWIGIFGVGMILIGSTYVAFLEGWWLPVVPPFLAFLGSTMAITAYIARTAADIRKTFGRYLTDQVVANLLENPQGLSLGGERRKITILTSDLRGFTATSERLPPEEVVKILNFYLGKMADVITEYEGTIDEFMGDGILVLFGAPTAQDNDAQRAIACAVAMQLAMKSVNEQMKQWDLPKLEMGIGINTGEVVVGNIGSEKRTKYGVVGSQVNLTYRVESYTLGGQILIAEATLKEAGSMVVIESEKQVQPKGVQEPISIYEVGGIKGNYNLFLAKQEEIFVKIPQPLSLQYSILDGKNVADIKYHGKLVELSANGGIIDYDHDDAQGLISGMTNIKCNLFSSETSELISDDIYAKVLDKSNKNGGFYIRFTAKPPNITKQLEEIYQSLI
ncbi:adenylate cyclase [Crocosphaera subtropica ATCC 51142]|uniref:Adenylate cyclase n=1 Tax=Crocosphaera subtropica (strain ATCC 51142 / BH68) TaxID=43989 RepID=B1WPM6_CROS5|nr:adenylate/guanylate cyclase domain-containing protein [Crocosphaera subtropica]ACB51596.1 adenylate cyclase [Crocosphaera subtropica ATCC 51142]